MKQIKQQKISFENLENICPAPLWVHWFDDTDTIEPAIVSIVNENVFVVTGGREPLRTQVVRRDCEFFKEKPLL